MIKSRAVLANCTTGRGPSGSCASHIRHARTSRNMRFSDIHKPAVRTHTSHISTTRSPLNDFANYVAILWTGVRDGI
jgi:hypothetical protein